MRRSWRVVWRLCAVLLALIMVGALVGVLYPLVQADALPAPPLPPFTPEPPDLQETLVLGSTTFAPQTPGSVRVLVRDPRSGTPLAGAAVRLSLAPVGSTSGEALFSGLTGELGTVDAAFDVPALAEGEWSLVVEVDGPIGAQRIVRPAVVQRAIDAALAMDRAVYHPGDVVHGWLWAVGQVDRRPVAGVPVRWTLLDARGNPVCSQANETSQVGTANGACRLADVIGEGTYRMRAALDGITVEREVEVRRSAPGELGVELRMREGYLLLGAPAVGAVTVTDPYGDPVDAASVAVSVRRDPGVEALHALYAAGETDPGGVFAFEAEWDLRAAELLGETPGTAWLVAQVEDASGRRGQSALRLPVSAQALYVTAWPENGALKPGVESLVRVRVAAPDGTPVRCQLEATFGEGGAPIEAACDEEGMAYLRTTPEAGPRLTITVRAVDGRNHEATSRFTLPVLDTAQPLVIRPDRDVYRPGEEIRVDAIAPADARAVYLDVRVNGQPVAAYAAPVVSGHASFGITPPGALPGRVELDAYAWLPDGTLARDVRAVLVRAEPALDLSLSPDARVHPAGGSARVLAQAIDARGGVEGVISAWATLSSAGGVALAPPAGAVRAPSAVAAPDLAPQYAEVVSRTRPVPAAVQRELTAYDLAWTARRQRLGAAAERAQWGMVGVAALAWTVVLPVLWRSGVGRGRTAIGALLAWALLTAGGVLLAHGALAAMGVGAVVALTLAWLGAVVTGLVQAWLDRDRSGLVALVLTVGAAALAVGIRAALERGGAPASAPTSAGWVALAATTLAACVLGVARLAERRFSRASASLALVALVGCTWGGGVLAGRGPDVPAYQAPTLPAPLPVPPTPVPVQGEQTLYLPAAQEERLPFADAFALSDDDVLFWEPERETDAQGEAALQVPLPASPGEVRLHAIAVGRDGAWGAAEVALLATQPLVAHFSPPTEVSVGDRLDLPLSLHNAVSISQTVQVTLTEAPWFRLRQAGAGVQQAVLQGGETRVLVLPVEARVWGEQTLTVTVESEAWRGVITRTVAVAPDGMWVARAYSWWTADWTSHLFRIPWSALADTDQIAVKAYLGPHAILEEALGRAVQQGGAAFDQAAAGVEARLLYVRYLEQTGRWEGAERAALEQMLAYDAQRLLAYQTPEGGFSVLGSGTPDLFRSATALRCLGELAALSLVDHSVVDGAARWLLGQQGADGTWRLADLPASWSRLRHAELPVTAYVTWALVDAGYGDARGVVAAAAYLEQMMDQVQDAYVLSLVANALVARQQPSDALSAALARLSEQAAERERMAVWSSDLQTLSGSVGGDPDADGYMTPSRRVEVTALATHALAHAGVYPEQVAKGLAMLTDSRDVNGTWSAPWATVWALRAYLASLPEPAASPGEVGLSSAVQVTVGDAEAEPLLLEGDVGAQAAFSDLSKGYNDVQIAVDGDEVAFQIVGSYCTLWSQVPAPLPEEEDLSVEVRYARTSVEVGDAIDVSVDVMLNRPGEAPLVELELGVPPGLSPISADLDRLVAEGTIARHERDGQRLLIHLLNLSSQQPLRFTYRLRALYPVRVSTGPTYAWDVSNPQRPAIRAPIEIEVLGRQ